MVKTSFSF